MSLYVYTHTHTRYIYIYIFMGLSFLDVRKKNTDFSKAEFQLTRCCRRNCNWPHLCHVQRAWTALMLAPGKRWRFWSWRLGKMSCHLGDSCRDGTPLMRDLHHPPTCVKWLGDWSFWFRFFLVGEMLQVAIVAWMSWEMWMGSYMMWQPPKMELVRFWVMLVGGFRAI